VQDAVKGYYNKKYNTPINVTRAMYDSLGNVTDDVANATKFEFLITLKVLIPEESTIDI
jgi:hypothetical protein